jgi:hypothetical protein
MGLALDTPFGPLADCVEVIETTPLEPGSRSRKLYARGIGLVLDGALRLTAIEEGDDEDDDDHDGCGR